MSFGSSADIIPFTRFLECRQRRHRIAAHFAARMAAADGGVRPEVADPSKDDDGASRRVAYGQSSTRRCHTPAEAASERPVKCF
jgi:hypothetical protein